MLKAIEYFCSNVEVFTVTLDQFNVFLLNKSINLSINNIILTCNI